MRAGYDRRMDVPQISVVATALPLVDRRALSQAWYDSLHLAARTPRPQAAARARVAASASGIRGAHAPASPHAPSPERNATRPASARTAHGTRPFAPHPAERRVPPSLLARRLAHAVRVRRRAASATVVVRAAGARVGVVVRSDGASLKLIAVCAPRVREHVVRALAHARYALAVARA